MPDRAIHITRVSPAGTTTGRNLARHEAWLAKLECPIPWLDGSESVDVLTQKVVEAL